MAISRHEFNLLWAEQQESLPARLLRLLQHSKMAHTADELAALLVGDSGQREPLVDPKVEEVLPTIKEVLDGLVILNRARKVVATTSPLGPKVFYAQVEGREAGPTCSCL
jgi:hypothetical protein